MWVEITKVHNIEGLLEVGYTWLLDTYGKEDCLGLWYDLGTTASLISEQIGTVEIKLAVILHGRLYPTEVTAVQTKEGIFVRDEVFT